MEKPKNLGNWFETIIVLLTFPGLWLVFIVLVALHSIPAYFIRLPVQIIAKVLHPDWGSVMTGNDAVVGADCLERPQLTILWYTVIEGKIELETLIHNFNERVILRKDPATGKLMYPRWQMYFEKFLSYNFWKWDTSFDIRNHVKYLPGSNENVTTTEKQVLSILGPLSTSPLMPKRPYWEILCVPNYLPKGETVPTKTMIIYKIHHGICDGYSLLKCFMQHIFNDDLGRIVKLKGKPMDGNIFKQFCETVWYFIQIPYYALKLTLLDVDSNSWFLTQDQLRQENHLSMTKRISVSSIKRICKKQKVAFSSVLFSALAGGINKHFKLKENGLRKPIRRVPKLVRCLTPLPWKNHPNNTLINHWTCANVPIYPAIDCPLERLIKTDISLKALVKSPSPLLNHILYVLGGTYPFPVIRFGNWFNTIVLSNFPGPTESVNHYGDSKFKGHDLHFWMPHLNGKSGIGVGIITYGDSLRYGLNFDKAILPSQEDVDDLCKYIEDELETLTAAKPREARVDNLYIA